jgi:hypothetical protein
MRPETFRRCLTTRAGARWAGAGVARRAAGAAGGALALAIAAPPARAQSLDQRVATVRDGRAQLRFAARPGVCGDGRGSIGTGGDVFMGNYDVSAGGPPFCAPGPVRVVLTVRGGQVERVKTYVNGNDSLATDLGVVGARDAAEWLLALARRVPGHSGEEAIVGAVVADSTTVWPALLPIARDHALPGSTRESAVFWLSRAAAAKVNGTALLDDRRDDGGDDDDIRGQAVFALSQQPRGEAVPALTRIARTNKDPAVRAKALFWLGQVGGEEAVSVFEEILRR